MRARMAGLVLGVSLVLATGAFAQVRLLNVSYDPTRELYQDVNKVFIEYWQKKTGQQVEIRQSHGGSGKQARTVLDGLEADVVTLALAYDIDMLSEKGPLLPADWQSRLPQNSCPYTSTIVFLVRKGNPKNIKDWDDLVRDGVAVITPNPKTSGGARWNYMAAWGYALRKNNNDEAKAREFITQLFKNVPVLDTGARGSTTTFAERGIGDVMIAWENEALLAVNKLGVGEFEIVLPSVSILAEPPVAVVDQYANKHKTAETAKAYLEFLYTEEGQDICAKHYYRPRSEQVLKKYAAQFPSLEMFTIAQLSGTWKQAQDIHFSDGGVFDSVFQK